MATTPHPTWVGLLSVAAPRSGVCRQGDITAEVLLEAPHVVDRHSVGVPEEAPFEVVPQEGAFAAARQDDSNHQYLKRFI